MRNLRQIFPPPKRTSHPRQSTSREPDLDQTMAQNTKGRRRSLATTGRREGSLTAELPVAAVQRRVCGEGGEAAITHRLE